MVAINFYDLKQELQLLVRALRRERIGFLLEQRFVLKLQPENSEVFVKNDRILRQMSSWFRIHSIVLTIT